MLDERCALLRQDTAHWSRPPSHENKSRIARYYFTYFEKTETFGIIRTFSHKHNSSDASRKCKIIMSLGRSRNLPWFTEFMPNFLSLNFTGKKYTTNYVNLFLQLFISYFPETRWIPIISVCTNNFNTVS